MDEQKWLEEGWFFHNHAWHLLHEIIKTIPEGTRTMLDYGAGTGIAAAVIRAVYPNIEPFVVDISGDSLNFWEKRNLDGDIINDLELIYSDNRYDFVMSSHVMEHIEPILCDVDTYIQELFRVAKKRVTIVVPDGDVHFYDHKVIYNRSLFIETIEKSLKGEKYKLNCYPFYHPHINNLIAVIDKV